MAAHDEHVPLPKPKRIRYAPILRKLMEDRDKDGAIAMIQEASGTTHGFHMVNFMKHVRERIAKDPRYLNPRCVHELLEIIKSPSTSTEDRKKLSNILETPAKLRWMQVRKGCLEGPETFQKVCEIMVFDPMYYEFMPTPEMQQQCSNYRDTLIKINHQHKHKKQEEYSYTESEVDEMVQWASEFCLRDDLDWTVRKNSLNMLEALCLLTGRRKWELCKTLQMRSSPDSDYQALVWGICKDIKSGQTERPIPLLAPIATIACGINKLRRFPHQKGNYLQGRISRRFPKMSHTFFRNIYTERTYRDRHINQFHPEPCSKLWWCSQALCDTLKTYCEHYATATVNHHAASPSPESGSRESSDGGFEFNDLDETEMADSPN